MFVGIDVSKAYLDVFIRPTSQRMRLGNDEPGIAQLVGHLESVQPTLVVLEPTGGLQTPVVAALVVRHIPVAVVNPRQIRDFGPVRPEPRPIADDQTQALDALLTRRRQLVEMITAETNRLAAAQGSRRGDSLESGMARKGRRAQDRAGGRPRRRGNATRRAPGARSPQPQADRRARRRRADGIGVAPFYRRLIAAGKAKKLAIVACMRKLLVAINAMMRDASRWQSREITA